MEKVLGKVVNSSGHAVYLTACDENQLSMAPKSFLAVCSVDGRQMEGLAVEQGNKRMSTVCYLQVPFITLSQKYRMTFGKLPQKTIPHNKTKI